MDDFKIGQKVKIIGDVSDFTEELDGHIGVITDVRYADMTVDIIDRPDANEWNCGWEIWKNNAISIDE